jgi:hypothetical protein
MIQIRADTLDGSPADFSGWQLYLADAIDNGFGTSAAWTISPSGLIYGITSPPPPGDFNGPDTVLGMFKLPSQRCDQGFLSLFLLHSMQEHLGSHELTQSSF